MRLIFKKNSQFLFLLLILFVQLVWFTELPSKAIYHFYILGVTLDNVDEQKHTAVQPI